MATVNDAVRAAAQFFAQLDHKPAYQELSVEEVELDEQGHFWSITLGYTAPNPLPLATPIKSYRVFRVNNSTGEVVSMKIREPEHA